MGVFPSVHGGGGGGQRVCPVMVLPGGTVCPVLPEEWGTLTRGLAEAGEGDGRRGEEVP